jgi:hypothetical protein
MSFSGTQDSQRELQTEARRRRGYQKSECRSRLASPKSSARLSQKDAQIRGGRLSNCARLSQLNLH